MSGENPERPSEDDPLRRSAKIPVPPSAESATLLGDRGEELVRALGDYFVGKASIADLGPAVDRAPDGTLRIKVDRESFEALGLVEQD
jgi:hypothetical protein